MVTIIRVHLMSGYISLGTADGHRVDFEDVGRFRIRAWCEAHGELGRSWRLGLLHDLARDHLANVPPPSTSGPSEP